MLRDPRPKGSPMYGISTAESLHANPLPRQEAGTVERLSRDMSYTSLTRGAHPPAPIPARSPGRSHGSEESAARGLSSGRFAAAAAARARRRAPLLFLLHCAALVCCAAGMRGARLARPTRPPASEARSRVAASGQSSPEGRALATGGASPLGESRSPRGLARHRVRGEGPGRTHVSADLRAPPGPRAAGGGTFA